MLHSHKGNVAIPIAIVAAGALIAAALFFALGNQTAVPPGGAGEAQPLVPVRGVQPDDHIKGNPDARIVVIEYSDTECRFCKLFHETMNQVIAQYEPSDVAWVYRHLPFQPGGAQQAEALECAAHLAGNDGFWAYADRLYEVTPLDGQLPPGELDAIAAFTGLDAAAFTQCIESGDMRERVEQDFNEATAAGGRGTPHNIILFNGEQLPLEGAQPLEVMVQIIDQLLAQEG